MREIKFRGKTKYGSWVYGYYFLKITEEGEPVHQIIENFSDLNRHNPGMKVKFHQVKPETVGQYTNQKDKNGKEIYEGDILEFEIDGCKHKTGPVSWRKDMSLWKFGIGINTPIPEDLCVADSSYKVIGNKYENPELLEGE